MKISNAFSLGKTQAELDFVDVSTDRDTPVFVDPYALEIKDDAWSIGCGDHIRSFFQEVIDALKLGNQQRSEHLVSHLQEARETFLGVSRGAPRGRGIGTYQSAQLLAALKGSRAVTTGVLSDLAEAELFIDGIGRDKVSDLTTNIIRGPLIEYTKTQCDLHGIPLTHNLSVGPVWDMNSTSWVQRYQSLPVIGGKPVIMVPKVSVRKQLSLDSQEFYNFHMIEFLQEEYLNAGSSLVQVLRSGPRVTKKAVKARHPRIKDDMADFVRKHPEVLEEYKRIKGAEGPLGNADFDENLDEAALASALANALANVRPGGEDASKYHSLMVGILSFLFFPGLICPQKEVEIHSGRKRLDIRFTNASNGTFFKRILDAAQTRAITVPVECKNYSREIANPELDQISSRFGSTRGFFGIICCRSFENRALFTERCKDTARDGRGFVVALDDEDVTGMLQQVAAGNRDYVLRFMNDRLNDLTT